jgi:ATP-dependent DNA helicase PIF1
LRRIIDALPAHSTACTASTGVAASALPRGTTVHYFWGCGIGTDDDGQYKADEALVAMAKRNRLDVLTTVTHLVIDEISMISKDFFTALEVVLRKVRKCDLPFGGVTLILCGDFLQV